MIFKIFRKIFDPHYSDRQVQSIQADTKKKFDETGEVAKRHAALLRKNGVTMRIYIASGGEHGH